MAISILGKRVLLQRRDRHWTQRELAERTGISANTIARLERGGVQDLRGSAIVRLAEALGVSTDYLLGREAEPESEYEPASVALVGA